MYDVVAARRAADCPARSSPSRRRVTVVQAYEYTGGLAPGAPVAAAGAPLSARLGPGLLGGVFDGLLRPLSGAGDWLTPGATRARRRRPASGRSRRRWRRARPWRRATCSARSATPARCRCRCSCRPGVAGAVDRVAAGRRATPPTRCWPWSAAPTVRAGRPRGRSRRPRPCRERLDAAEAAAHRPAGARPALPGRPRQHGGRAGRLRHRQDGAAAADRQVVRRRRDRLRRLRRARQRDGRRRRRARRARRTRAPAAGSPTGPSSSPTPRTCR